MDALPRCAPRQVLDLVTLGKTGRKESSFKKQNKITQQQQKA
jgi:hypothetical protein